MLLSNHGIFMTDGLNSAVLPQGATIHAIVTNLFRMNGFWREDAHKVISTIIQTYYCASNELKSALRKNDGSALNEAAIKCAAIIKFYWAICGQAQQSSADRLTEAEMLLNNFVLQLLHKKVAHDQGFENIQPHINYIGPQESEQIKKLHDSLLDLHGIPKRYTKVRPMMGTLVPLGRDSGRNRQASSIGVDSELVNVSARKSVERFLAAYAH